MTDELSAPSSLHHWSGYEPSDPKLIALYSKGKTLQWNADTEIDWDQPIDPSSPLHAAAFPLLDLPIFRRLSPTELDHLTEKLTRLALSQIIHGEQGALMVASRLVSIAPDYETKLYAATQTVDEARHVEVFGRYLRRCGGIVPLAPGFGAFLDKVIDADSWLTMVIGMQIIVEGAALSSFHTYRRRSREPLLTGILDRVIRDEARHVGFGSTYLRNNLSEMSDDEREHLADYAYDTVMMFARTRHESFRQSEGILSEFGFSLDEVLHSAAERLQSGEGALADPARDGITEFILPTLTRLGVLTERVKEKFASARLPPIMVSTLLDELDILTMSTTREN
ncbi:MAG TPA: ferritin-like domain-containing protein [Allosphingosinicella sp.]|nr:ferritin-like domain-containing protein [Allosphingosinicella sp.]